MFPPNNHNQSPQLMNYPQCSTLASRGGCRVAVACLSFNKQTLHTFLHLFIIVATLSYITNYLKTSAACISSTELCLLTMLEKHCSWSSGGSVGSGSFRWRRAEEEPASLRTTVWWILGHGGYPDWDCQEPQIHPERWVQSYWCTVIKQSGHEPLTGAVLMYFKSYEKPKVVQQHADMFTSE